MTKRRTLHPKVASIGFAGALSTIIVGLLHRAHIEIQADEVAALTMVITAIIAWLAPERVEQILLDEYNDKK